MFILRIVILYSLIFILVLLIGCKSNNNPVENNNNSGGNEENTDENMSCMDTTNCWNIYYDTNTSIGGFQFNVTGIIVLNTSGGDAEAFGMFVQTGNNIVLGFSMAGASIPAGNGILNHIEYEGNINDVCITNIILSDPLGEEINTEIINCQTIKEQ